MSRRFRPTSWSSLARVGGPGKESLVSSRRLWTGSGPSAGAHVIAHVDSGGWAERVAVPSDRLAVLPDAVADRTAAALPLTGLTAAGRSATKTCWRTGPAS
jgi:NADPH:quinone reductase-like Zn-dependent oxidoreductase